MAQQYPTLYAAVPAFNYLIDQLEDELEVEDSSQLKALEAALAKLKKYYTWTDANVYAISTGG